MWHATWLLLCQFNHYVTFIINLVFSFIIYLILVNIFLKILHLPSGYEILQTCTQPRRWTISSAVVVWKKLELWQFQWIMSLFLRKGKKTHPTLNIRGLHTLLNSSHSMLKWFSTKIKSTVSSHKYLVKRISTTPFF
jgi:hypothetical protein